MRLQLYRQLVELARRGEYKDPQALADFRIGFEAELGLKFSWFLTFSKGNYFQKDLFHRYLVVKENRFEVVRCRICGGYDIRAKELQACFWCRHGRQKSLSDLDYYDILIARARRGKGWKG